MSARALAFRTSTIHDAEPFASMNITPLIDVLLVLIVTLIMTIPMMTHKVPIDLPSGGTVDTHQPRIHRIVLDADGRLAFDGAPIDDKALRVRLDAVRADSDAQVEFSADGAARYERFDQTLATIKRSGITKLGFVGNERFQDFSAVK